MIRLFPLIGLSLSLCGCAKRAYRVNAEIPPPCIRKVRIIHCTPDLLKCEKVAIEHDKGCEILELK